MSNSTNTPDDADLLKRLLAGEKAAFEIWVKKYHNPMKRVAAAIIGEGQAEEVVQEAFMAAIRQLPQFEGRSSLKTWLFAIVSNQAKSRLRKDKREVYLEDITYQNVGDDGRFVSNGHWAEPPSHWHDNSPESLLGYEDFRNCLDKTIHRLPEIQKAVLTLREYQGMELEEICNILNLTASNIRVLIHRARTKVHAMIEHYEETGTC